MSRPIRPYGRSHFWLWRRIVIEWTGAAAVLFLLICLFLVGGY